MKPAERDRLLYAGIRPSWVAKDLGCSPAQVLELIRSGKLEAIDIGTASKPVYRVSREGYERFLAEKKVRTEADAA